MMHFPIRLPQIRRYQVPTYIPYVLSKIGCYLRLGVRGVGVVRKWSGVEDGIPME